MRVATEWNFLQKFYFFLSQNTNFRVKQIFLVTQCFQRTVAHSRVKNTLTN